MAKLNDQIWLRASVWHLCYRQRFNLPNHNNKMSNSLSVLTDSSVRFCIPIIMSGKVDFFPFGYHNLWQICYFFVLEPVKLPQFSLTMLMYERKSFLCCCALNQKLSHMFLLPQISFSSCYPVIFAHRTDMGHPPCQAQVFLWEWPVRDLQIRTKFQHCALLQVNCLTTQFYVTCLNFDIQRKLFWIHWEMCLPHIAQRQTVGGFNQPPTLKLWGGVGGQCRGCGEWRGHSGACVPQFRDKGPPISHRTCLHAAIETTEGEFPQAPFFFKEFAKGDYRC